MTAGWVARVKNWRPVKNLDAPKGYRGDDDDVLYEKNDAYISGFIVGVMVSGFLFMLTCLLTLVLS